MPTFAASLSMSGRAGLNSGPRSKMRMCVKGVGNGSGVGKWCGPNIGVPSPCGAVAVRTGPSEDTMPAFNSQAQQVRQKWTIGGITKDSTGAVLPLCQVLLFVTKTKAFVAETQSDDVGAYLFTTDGSGEQYFVVSYKAGSPDVAGTTLNTLTNTLL